MEGRDAGDSRLSLPWDELADASEAIEEAVRFGSIEEQNAARRWFDEARDRLGLVSATIFAAALSQYGAIDGVTPLAGYVTEGTWKAMADRLGVPVKRKFIRDYREVSQRLTECLDSLQAMGQQMREMQRRIDELTPGVGEK